MTQIYWLASYPKSGNTWMRIFLNNYWENADQPININELERTTALYVRDYFDEVLHIESALLTYAEIDALRPVFHRTYTGLIVNINGQFCKVHDAFERLPDGTPMFPADATAGGIYIVRNPLDVVVSYAHHNAASVEDTIDVLVDDTHALSMFPNTQSHQLHQHLRTWSRHVESWLEQREFPLLVVRYEDMLLQPHEAFAAVIRFIQWEVDAVRLDKAIRFSAFDELKQQETKHGFHEKPKSAESFFRKGQAGDWQNVLTQAQVERIVSAHHAIMKRFDYLPVLNPSINDHI